MYDYRYENKNRINFIIDMQSFYASLEIASLGLDTKTTPLVVVSKRDNDGSGLVMSASPAAKELFGIKNVGRAKNLPNDKRLLIATPRMKYYVEKNAEINRIFNRYTAFEDIYPYSIDESLLDLTGSWHLFGDTPFDVALKIQKDIKEELGIDTKIGIAPTLTMAKIALDIDAKKHPQSIAEWKFEDIPEKLWPIKDLNSIWSIGRSTTEKLYAMGILSMYDLAHTNPEKLRKTFGKRGETLFALSYGVDRGIISDPTSERKDHGLGNSQVLPRNYTDKDELHLIVTEISDYVIKRIHEKKLQTNLVSLNVSYTPPSFHFKGGGFSKRKKLSAHTSSRNIIIKEILALFDQIWDGSPVRYVSVSLGGLQEGEFEQNNLFEEPLKEVKKNKQDKVIEELQNKFGFKAVFKASSKLEGGTALYRSKLIGGHNAERKDE